MIQGDLLKSVHVVAWYPEIAFPHAGVFIKEHIRSISLFSSCDVLFLRFTKRNGLPKISIVKEKQDLINVHYIDVYSPIRRFGIHNFLVKRAYRKALKLINSSKEADIYHIHVRNKYTKVFTQLNEIKNRPIVLTEHFSFYHTGIKLLPQEKQVEERKEIKAWFKNQSLKKIMPVSFELGNVLVNDFDVDEKLIHPIPNIAYKSFYFEKKNINDKTIISLVANWQYPKNPILFFDSLLLIDETLLRKIEINIVGIGQQLNEMKKYVNQHCSHINIEFHGLQDKEFIGELLRKSNLLVHPTDAENLPTIIIESLCCGTPVVTTKVNGIPELINDSNGLMSQAKDVEAFSKNLEYMIKHHDLYNNELISNDALKLFSEKQISKRFEIIYNDVL